MSILDSTSRLPRPLQFLGNRTFLISTGIVVGLFLLLNYVALPMYVNHGSRATVPSVVGMSFDEASKSLEKSGLRIVLGETRPDPAFAPGLVIQQNPAGLAIVKEGRRVYVTLSGGEVQVVVPSLRGRSLRDARFALERFGLKLGGVSYDTSDTFPENTIIYQSSAADTRVTKGTSVNIVVSKGKVLTQALVPLVVGKTRSEAEQILAAAGLKVGNITFQQSFELVPNTIVDQYPRQGEPATPGQAVDLFVVKDGRPSEEFETPPKE
jgi:eukaryotic-like serine/threonine-protein kinase